MYCEYKVVLHSTRYKYIALLRIHLNQNNVDVLEHLEVKKWMEYYSTGNMTKTTLKVGTIFYQPNMKSKDNWIQGFFIKLDFDQLYRNDPTNPRCPIRSLGFNHVTEWDQWQSRVILVHCGQRMTRRCQWQIQPNNKMKTVMGGSILLELILLFRGPDEYFARIISYKVIL